MSRRRGTGREGNWEEEKNEENEEEEEEEEEEDEEEEDDEEEGGGGKHLDGRPSRMDCLGVALIRPFYVHELSDGDVVAGQPLGKTRVGPLYIYTIHARHTYKACRQHVIHMRLHIGVTPPSPPPPAQSPRSRCATRRAAGALPARRITRGARRHGSTAARLR